VVLVVWLRFFLAFFSPPSLYEYLPPLQYKTIKSSPPNHTTKSKKQEDKMALPYIGATLRLTSHTLHTYTGTLTSIDAQNSTVTLKDVTSGTREGKWEYIVFRGNEIKGLEVLVRKLYK